MLSSLSFDLDGLWSALELHSIYSNPKKDKALEEGIPLILKILKKEGINALFFLVGKNIENYPELHKEIAENHEIGNHTYSHPHRMSSLKKEIIKEEIVKCHNIIKKITKIIPKSFRTPTYQVNNFILDELESLNYKYDSSFMPSYFPGINPLSNLFLKRRPHKIRKNLTEIPISVNPIIPLHVNGSSVMALGLPWLKFSMKTLKIFNLPLIINFHALDFIEVPNIIKKHRKRRHTNAFPLIEKALSYINKNSKITSMEEIAKRYI